MPNFLGIVFDLNGVLIKRPNTNIIDDKSLNRLRHDFGTGKIDENEYIDKLSKATQQPRSKIVNILESIYGDVSINIPVYNIYRRITSRKCIFTDTNPIQYRFILKNLDIRPDEIVASHIIGFRKDNINSYIHIEELLGSKKGDILYIDDNQENLYTAIERGWNTVLYTTSTKLNL